MKSKVRTVFALGASLALTAPVMAQAPAPAPAPAVPEKMPFDIPYGNTITLEQAKKAADVTLAESAKRGWKIAVAVVSPHGDLIYFARMEDTQWASSDIAPRKAKTAARLRRETKVFADAAEKGNSYPATLDPQMVVSSPGGIPIVVGGKLIGGIGCSGAAGVQDAVVCQAGVDALGK